MDLHELNEKYTLFSSFVTQITFALMSKNVNHTIFRPWVCGLVQLQY